MAALRAATLALSQRPGAPAAVAASVRRRFPRGAGHRHHRPLRHLHPLRDLHRAGPGLHDPAVQRHAGFAVDGLRPRDGQHARAADQPAAAGLSAGQQAVGDRPDLAAAGLRLSRHRLVLRRAAATLGPARGLAGAEQQGNGALGLYEYSRSFAKGVMRTRAVLAWGVSCVVAFVLVVLLQLDQGYNLVSTFAMLAITMSLVMIWRELSFETLPHAMTVQRVLIYGAGQRARSVAESLQQSDPNVQVVGFFASPNESEITVPEVQRVSAGRSLTDVVRDHDVDEIVVALTERRGGSMPMRELLDCKLQGVRVVDIARHFEQKLGQIRLDAMSAGYLIFGEGFNQDFIRTLVKRCFDIAGALVLILLGLPLMLITALAIRIDSPGPVLYRQERVGLHGRS